MAPAIVAERRGVIEAFGRSYELVRGHGWTVFGAIVVAFLILIVVGIIFAIIGAAIGDLAGRIIFTILANILVAPFPALVASVLFFGLGGSSRRSAGTRRSPRPRPPERISGAGARVERRNAIAPACRSTVRGFGGLRLDRAAERLPAGLDGDLARCRGTGAGARRRRRPRRISRPEAGGPTIRTPFVLAACGLLIAAVALLLFGIPGGSDRGGPLSPIAEAAEHTASVPGARFSGHR